MQSYSSLQIGERVHEPLQSFFRKIGHDYSDVSPVFLYNVVVKTLNDAFKRIRTFPARISFGLVSRFLNICTDISTGKERMEILETTQA